MATLKLLHTLNWGADAQEVLSMSVNHSTSHTPQLRHLLFTNGTLVIKDT